MMPWLRRNIQRDFNSLPISENFPVYTNKYRMIIIIYFDLVLCLIKTTPPLKWFKCREDRKNVFVQWQTKFEKHIGFYYC